MISTPDNPAKDSAAVEPSRKGARSNRTRWLCLFPVPALLVGAATMQQSGLRTIVWTQNGAIWLLTCFLCLLWPQALLRPCKKRGVTIALMVCGIAIMGSTFFFAGLNGVHRWISLGALRLQPAAIVLPLLLICVGSVPGAVVSVTALLAVMLLVFQPDPASATAFTVALAVRGVFGKGRLTAVECTTAVLSAALLIYAWTLEDPLPQVAHVEGIMALARSVHPALAWAGIIAMLLLLLPFVLCIRGHGRERATLAGLAAYFVVMETVCLTGRFPVPVMGYGASPVIGYVLTVAWAATSFRESSSFSFSFPHFR